MADYQLKQPVIPNYYEGEYPVNLAAFETPPAICIIRYSFQGTDGLRREDHKAGEFAADCQKFGYKWAGYHFLRPNGITEQANLFIEAYRKYGGYRPIVDVEINLDSDPSGIGRADWAGQVKTFLDLVENATGQKCIIYTSKYYWSFLNDRNGNPPYWTSLYDCWAVFWPDQPDEFNWIPDSMIPAGFFKDRCAMWQYTGDTGRANGYPVNDLNIPSEWYLAEIGGVPEGNGMNVTPAGTSGSKIRDNHYVADVVTGGKQIGALPYGSAAPVSEEWTTGTQGQPGYERWVKCAFNGVIGWVACFYNGVTYATTSGVLEPPVDPPPPTGEAKPTSMDLVLHYADGTSQFVNGIQLPNAT